MTEREALKLALEALEISDEFVPVQEAITAIKEALAQPEQEQVAYTGNGTAGRGADVRPTGFFFQMPPQTNAYDNMLKAIDSMRPAARVIKDKPATWWLDEFEKVVRNLKEKNT